MKEGIENSSQMNQTVINLQEWQLHDRLEHK